MHPDPQVVVNLVNAMLTSMEPFDCNAAELVTAVLTLTQRTVHTVLLMAPESAPMLKAALDTVYLALATGRPN